MERHHDENVSSETESKTGQRDLLGGGKEAESVILHYLKMSLDIFRFKK